MLEREIDKIVSWLQERVKAAKSRGLVAGISGGVDSAVVAALIKQACPETSLGLILPISSDPQDLADARMVIEKLNLTTIELDFTSEHQSMTAKSWVKLSEHYPASELNKHIADANLRARLRMCALYTTANALNYLVVGTDNKAEYFIGYFTKYGDGGCDLLPLLDFTKAEVYAMARILGIPERIIAKKPSAGLWPEQTDEAEIGTTYAMVDAYLNGQPIPDLDREIIERMHERSKHKRALPPAYHRS